MANYTLNYTGEKVDELLNKIDTAFGETTVTKDAITWDGNTDGLDNAMGVFYRISSAVPTLEDCQKGGTFTMNTNGVEETIPFAGEEVMDAESMGAGSNMIVIGSILIATADGAIGNMGGEIALPKAGIYFIYMDDDGNGVNDFISKFTINDYIFTETEVKTIDKKYLPSGASGGGGGVCVELDLVNGKASMTSTEIIEALNAGTFVFVVYSGGNQVLVGNIISSGLVGGSMETVVYVVITTIGNNNEVTQTLIQIGEDGRILE